MKIRFVIFIIIFMSGATWQPCQAQENAQQFIAAIKAYKAKNFSETITNLEAIVKTGPRSGALFYNIGNAYLKNDDLGHAILWYERALKIMPNDPDLRFNCEYARSLTKDAAEDNTNTLVRIFFFWKYQLNDSTIIHLAVGLNLLFWSLLIAWRITRRKGFRFGAVVVFIPSIIFIFTAVFNYYESTQKTQGIVLSEKASIRSGLESTSTQLFVLHAGAKITIVKQLKDHLQIRFSQDKIGWVKKSIVGII